MLRFPFPRRPTNEIDEQKHMTTRSKAHELMQQKFNPPVQRANSCARSALIKLLSDNPFTTVRLLIGPAGFGKSTVMSQYVTEQLQIYPEATVVWISIDDSDNEDNQFFRLLSQAFVAKDVVNKSTVSESMNSASSALLEEFSTSLLTQIVNYPKKIMFVLDDLHHIDYPIIFRFLEKLLDIKSQGVQLIISSRISPSLNLSRYVIQGEVVEVNPENLRFTLEETQQLLANRLTVDEIKHFHHQSDGWPVAVQLLRIWSDQNPHARYEEQVSGSAHLLNRFLAEQVFSGLSAAAQHLLLHVSLLDRFSADFADYLCGTEHCARILSDLVNDFSLITPLNAERQHFRLHQLFANYLQEKLAYDRGPIYLLGLREKAASWLYQHGDILEAVKQCIKAKKPEMALHFITEAGSWGLVMTRGISLVESILNQFTPSQISHSSCLSNMKAYLCLKFGYLEEATKHQTIAQTLHASGEDTSAKATDLQVMRLILAVYTDENVTLALYEQTELLMEELPNEDHLAKGTILALQALVLNQVGKFNEAEKSARSSLLEMQLADCPVGVNYALFHFGLNLCYRGYIQQAEETLKQAYDMAIHHLGLDNGLTHMATCFLGLVRYQINQHELNEAAIEQSLHNLEKSDCWVELLIISYQMNIDLALSNSKPNLALQYVERGLRVAEQRNFRRLETMLRILELKIHVMSSPDFTIANEWLVQYDNLESNCWHAQLELGYTLSIYYWQKNQFRKARQYAEKIDAKATAIGVPYKRAPALGILSVIYNSEDLQQASFQQFLLLINLCTELKIIRPLILLPDSFEGIAQKLKNSKAWSTLPPASKALVESYLQTKGRETQQASITTTLSHRELQIIEYLTKGLTNKQLASEMGVSENTIKFHLKNLFTKLSVTNRTEAVIKFKGHI